MPKFRKKPVVIEAQRLTLGDSCEGVAAWCGGRLGANGCTIETLEGNMLAEWGDWIIRGAKGEFYPCKPDIFDATYEPA